MCAHDPTAKQRCLTASQLMTERDGIHDLHDDLLRIAQNRYRIATGTDLGHQLSDVRPRGLSPLHPNICTRYLTILLCSQLLKEDDANWPMPDRVGRQELEVVMGTDHISFTTTKLGSLLQVQQSQDPEGLRIFYYLVQVS